MEKEEKGQRPNALKFSFSEIFNNSNGQSAAAILIAFLITITGTICFVYCIFVQSIFLPHTVTFTALGVGIFTVRSFKNN
jgi:hypothetical protein